MPLFNAAVSSKIRAVFTKIIEVFTKIIEVFTKIRAVFSKIIEVFPNISFAQHKKKWDGGKKYLINILY